MDTIRNDKTRTLKRGWTTGACATAAVKAALIGLWGDGQPHEVSITLPKGEQPTFAITHWETSQDPNENYCTAGIIKDAGDDPDVTHGALIIAKVQPHTQPTITFHAGKGVGTVTKAGLPIAVNEPAINPKPREFMREIVTEMAKIYGKPPHVAITISIPNGETLAQKTWNPRLGIIGGLSVLGTTGIVRPFSCSAWIASIHRGVDVARAEGLTHVGACTGATSERTVQDLFTLPDYAMLDMGDFSGGLLKYLAKHPVPRLTIGGGIGKMVKMAQGAVDLHSGRSQVDFAALGRLSVSLGLADVSDANTALEALERTGAPLANAIAGLVKTQATRQSRDKIKQIDVVVINRDGTIMGRA